MTEKEKDNTISQLKELTHKYFDDAKRILNENDLVYASESQFKHDGIPFNGIMPVVNNDMIEDLCLDVIENPDCVQYDLHEKEYVEKRIAEYEDYHSPKNRIKRYMSEIERLKEKYHVTDEDLK